MIPDEAVEAAHKAWREQAALDGSIFEYNLRAALEAAAPVIAAVAWDECAGVLDDAKKVSGPTAIPGLFERQTPTVSPPMSKGTTMRDPAAAAQEAHRAALAAQKAMREASRERDKTVREARRAGVPAAELAAALGVNRHRIHAMLKAAETTQGE